jgi:HNH endonuclease
MSQELRYQVLNRDGFQCVYCGSRHELYIHHTTYPDIDTVYNLVTLCRRCHKRLHIDNPYLGGQISTIQLSKAMKERLGECTKKKGETYEEIIGRLIDVYNNRRDDAIEREFAKGISAANKKVKGVKTKD